MKPKNILRLLFIASLVIPAACDVKDPIFNTPHPGHGTVTLTTDWSGISTDLTTPGSYTVTATRDGSATAGYSATLTGVTNRLDHLFEPGTYRFCVYNTPEYITVDGSIATVATSDNTLHTLPGWLFSCTLNASLAQDAEYTLTALMQQQVRQLTLIIEPTGGTTDKIERIEGYLTGAASAFDLSDGSHAEPRNAELQFSRITSGTDAGKWSATVRLLGIAGERQKLNARIYFTNNTPRFVGLDSDLTTQLAAFNADKRTPMTLGGSVVETPTEAGFGATITDWETVTGDGPVVAN